MKKFFLLTLILGGLILNASQTQTKKSLYDQIKEKERELAVPRDTVPVEDNRFLIDSPIPKTAHYLPFLQTLLNIEVGSLPNPIGVSFIGSHTEERYRIKKFSGTATNQVGKNLCIANKNNSQLIPPSFKTQLTFACGLREKGYEILNQAIGAGKTKEWEMSGGIVEAKTSALGIKADMFIFPFMQVFATAAYLHMEQSTNIGTALIPLDKVKKNDKLDGFTAVLANGFLPPSAQFNGIFKNTLDGWMAMAGTNLAIGYKGFFASFMISGGYVQLDDRANDITGFVQKPFMYIAPRIGYSYHGIATIHFGVQRIELFGATQGKDLSVLTEGIIAGYSVEVEKFPVNFLAGLQFNFARDLGISVEYVGSPDTKGINAELAFRF